MPTQRTKLKDIPRRYLAIGVASLLINVLFFGLIVVGYGVDKGGYLDTAQVNGALDYMCSDTYRKKIEAEIRARGGSEEDRTRQLGPIDFHCGNNGAEPYLEQGYEAYFRSMGIER